MHTKWNRSHKNDTSCNFWPKLLAIARRFSPFLTFSRRCPPSFFTSPCFSCHFLYFPVLSCTYNYIELSKVTSSSAFCIESVNVMNHVDWFPWGGTYVTEFFNCPIALQYWTPWRGRSYKMASVCMSVCMYVCHSRPALTTPTIFLIFGMKVGDH